MTYTTDPELHVAAKQHRCTWCWQFIEPGEQYTRYRCYDCGDASTVKLHPECYDAMLVEAKACGGWIDWTPGQERPAPLTAPASTSPNA